MIQYRGLPTETARHYQTGGADDHGVAPERLVSSGTGAPCRHCLNNVPKGADMLVLAHRPFEQVHPYAETGPIFVCADLCEPPASTEAVPPVLTTSPEYLVKGYTADERIAYGTGKITLAGDISDRAETLFERAEIAFIDVRSARNNCWIARLRRD